MVTTLSSGLLHTTLSLWLLALLVIVGLKTLKQAGRGSGLLSQQAGGNIAPERLPMLWISVVYAGIFFFQGLEQGELPEVPAEILVALGLAHGAYLTGKFKWLK
jgi:hypothetical protein